MLDLVIRLLLAWLCGLDDKTVLVDNSVQEILMTTLLGAVFYKDLLGYICFLGKQHLKVLHPHL